MSKIDTEENRFHALKFALQTPVADYRDALDAANAYLAFLDGMVTKPTRICVDAAAPYDDTELSDLTESYPEDEPVVAMADSPQESAGAWLETQFEAADAGEPAELDAWAAADHAISDIALVSELFEEGPHAPEVFVSDDHAESLRPETSEQPEPTFEYVAAAVEQIASPPPPAPDATDEPELTDEQVERIEERLATPDQITAAEHEPERELETVDAYVNVHPTTRTKWPWMGS